MTLARAHKGKFNSAAVPGITELAFDFFAYNAKVETQKVPYKDIVQAVNDLAEDRLQVYSASYAILRPHHEGGRVVVLAQLGKERAPSLKNIPTGLEAGYPELEMDGNVGLFASKGVPAALIGQIGADVVAAVFRRQGGRGSAQRNRANTGARWTCGIRRIDRCSAQADRQHRQDAWHSSDAIGKGWADDVVRWGCSGIPMLPGSGAATHSQRNCKLGWVRMNPLEIIPRPLLG